MAKTVEIAANVTAYTYHIQGSTQPQFVYVEEGYDKSVLPPNVRRVVRSPRKTTLFVGSIFGSAGKKFFYANHYVGCELKTTVTIKQKV